MVSVALEPENSLPKRSSELLLTGPSPGLKSPVDSNRIQKVLAGAKIKLETTVSDVLNQSVTRTLVAFSSASPTLLVALASVIPELFSSGR